MPRYLSFLLVCLPLWAAPAYANCKTDIDAYELIDLIPDVEDEADWSALAIDKSGRVILQRSDPFGDTPDTEFIRESSGRRRAVKQADDSATRTTIALLDNRVRFVDFHRQEPGYLPVHIQTLVDRRGGEIAVSEYCQAPEEGSELTQFVISPSGKQMAGVFSSETRQSVARCRADKAAEHLFEAEPSLILKVISDAGVLAGITEAETGNSAWRWDTNGRTDFEFDPTEVQEISFGGIDENGDVYVSTTDLTKNQSLRLNANGERIENAILPGPGWDVMSQSVGPCGHIFGYAVHTNFESFDALSEDEKARLRDDMSAYMALAQAREEAYFVWSVAGKGLFLNAITAGLSDWSSMDIQAVNARGQAIGAATNPDGYRRPIMLNPIKR